jgi:Rieske Fe-S protein
VKIASLGQLPVGSTRVFNYPGEHDTCVLVHAQPGVLRAYGQKCTHLSCAVVPEPRDGVIACPCHEGLFDLKDGRPIAGPPRRPLPRIRLEQMGNDVYAVGVEYATT